MKKRNLMICVTVIAFAVSYPASNATAALTVQELVTGQKVTFDDNTGNYWYWNLSDFSDMTYSQQITAIGSLGDYIGLTGWHMADNDEMFSLWDVYSAEELRDNFGPSGTKWSTLWWGGRYDVASTANIDHHWVCQVTADMKYPFPSGDIPDDSPISWYGAWVVTSASCPIPASKPEVQWEKTFGGSNYEIARSVQQTTDGGYIIAGNTESYGTGWVDIYLVKTKSNGDMLWQETYGGAAQEEGFSVQQTRDGGYIICGYTHSFGAGNSDIYLIKTDSSGNVDWDETYGTSGVEVGYCVQQTSDDGYIICGQDSNLKVYLLKTNESGDKQWERFFSKGGGNEAGHSVHQTKDGGYIIAGGTYSGGAGGWDAYVIKTDSSGSAEWEKTFGGADDDGVSSVWQTTDGGYIFTGSTRSFGAGPPLGSGDIWLIKTDCDGNQQWQETYGGNGNELTGMESVQQTSDGGYIIAGRTDSYGAGGCDVYLIKTDSVGNMLWEKTVGGTYDDAVLSVKQTLDGGYVVAGFTESYGAGNYDLYLIKLSSPQPEASLIAYWSFDDTSAPGHDDSGNGNDGTVYGAASIDGICGDALSFDGIDDYVDVDIDASSVLRITGEITVGTWFWAEPDALLTDMLLVSRTGRDVNLHWCWKLGLLYSVPWVSISQTGNSEVSATGPDSVSSEEWHYLAMTYQPDNFIKLYLDGELVGNVFGNSVPDYINDPEGVPIFVGAFYRQGLPPGHPFPGKLDEVRIYDRSLSECEIKELATPCEPEDCWQEKPLVDTAANERTPIWSPDGKQIAYRSDESGSDQIYVTNSDGTGKWQLTNGTSMDIWFVTWSPDSKYLLYSYGNGHPYNLYKVKLNEARDGIADLWNLTQAPSTSSTLVWGPAYISPDGNYIVANRIYNGWPRLRIITNRDTNAHEGDWTPIGKNYGMSVNPSWKPDSSTIVYAYYDNYQHNNHSDICTILPNGTNDTILVDRSRTQQHTQTVAWCQSGSNLAFAEGLWSQTTKPLGLMTADGTNINWLDQGPAGLPWQHYSWQADLWSPDGSSILYSCKEDGNWNIYLIDKDGSNKRLVASSGGTDVLARFSGDGTVAFQTNRNGNWDIYIATSGPCNTEPVADAGDDQEVSTGAGGTVEVVLDCSDSSDPDGDELTYCWKWTGGQDCDATGVNPTIVLSCGTYVIELIVSDGTADSEPDYVQITVLDGTAPVISCPGDVTLECPADTNPANTGTATATDNCDDEPAITYGDVLSGACPEVIVRTWTATDDAGNSSSCEQTITVQDTTPPVISCPADVSLSPTDLGCVVTFNTAATAIDECDQAPQITSDPPLPATFEEIGEHTITFTATDSCGNSSQCSMTVTVLPTAYCLKQEAIAVLEGLLSKDQGDDDLIQAIGYLYMSLGDNVMAKAVADMDGSEVVWASPNRIAECQGGYKGADVFQYEQGACDKLDAYIDNDENTGFGFGAEIETVRQMMAEADQILAATAISDAHANSGNTDAIADAESLKDEGDAAKAIGGTEICDIALDKYEEAWEKAVGSWGCD